jgi:hypothetical protein
MKIVKSLKLERYYNIYIYISLLFLINYYIEIINFIIKVVCPVCKRKETIRGVRYLPLNVLSLRSIIKSKTVESMSICSRCYDDAPRYYYYFI